MPASGEKHWNWKGGRRSKEWKVNRELALERDNYTCQDCNSYKPWRLSVHHQTPFEISKDHSLENLISLCNSCHHKREAIFQIANGTYKFHGTREAWDKERKLKQSLRMFGNKISPKLERDSKGRLLPKLATNQ